MNQIDVRVNIPPSELLKWYKGQTREVQARSLDGQPVTFPFEILHDFIHQEGISGIFRISFNGQGKFQEIHRVSG